LPIITLSEEYKGVVKFYQHPVRKKPDANGVTGPDIGVVGSFFF
jgi:hypothetical protein